MKKKMCLFFVCMLLVLMTWFSACGQDGKGIQWVTGLTWEKVKQKAKSERKYIFIDAFATWCGPCKLMDKNVYANDIVGNYFNEKFVSVRVQMDQTKNDNEFVKSWYDDAAAIAKEYRVEGYPSYIFLSPQGEITHKEMGYQNVKELISLAEAATRPGKAYEDKYSEYDRLIKEYKQGVKQYERMPYMIAVAFKFGDTNFGKQLLMEHTEYVKKLKPQERYTKENIEMWSGFLLNSDGECFQFFYKDSKMIDQVMNLKGYASVIVDRTIQKEVIDSFFRMQKGETTLVTGKKIKNSDVMTLENMPVRSDGKIMIDNVEADWKRLYRMIRQKFDKRTTKRNVLAAMIKWYNQHSNFTAAAKYTLIQYRKDPTKLTPSNAYNMNDFAWNVFRYVPISEKRIITATIAWVRKAIVLAPAHTAMLDTYANLLYKAGRKDEAIMWEEKAVSFAEKENTERINNGLPPLTGGWAPETFKQIVEQMKRGEKTYVKEGALWN